MCVQVVALTPNLPAVTSAEVEIATLGPGSVDQGNCKGHALCSPMHHQFDRRLDRERAAYVPHGLRHPAQGCIWHR